MSNNIQVIVDHLVKLKESFEHQNNWGLTFNNECLFAKQLIQKNDFVMGTAQNNPGSLKSAIMNVAAIGISLNPATAHAYLVPRDGMICLDISYKGLVKLATDAGAISWAKAVLVYEGDTFIWNGPAEAPRHEADVFNADRIDANDPLKNLKGGYCLAKLPDGSCLVDIMTAGEILAVRDSSKAKNGPWQGKWAGEMAKKTLVKRASKSWPQSNGRERLDKAIEALNEHEGDRLIESKSVSDYLKHSPEQEAHYHHLLQGDPVEFYIWWHHLDDRIQTSLINSFEKGEKGKGRELTWKLEKTGRETYQEMFLNLTAACESCDDLGAHEVLEEAGEFAATEMISQLPMEQAAYVKEISAAA